MIATKKDKVPSPLIVLASADIMFMISTIKDKLLWPITVLVSQEIML